MRRENEPLINALEDWGIKRNYESDLSWPNVKDGKVQMNFHLTSTKMIMKVVTSLRWNRI